MILFIVSLNILTGVSCLGGIYWLYRRQERGSRTRQELLDESVKLIQGSIDQDLIQHKVAFDGLTGELWKALDLLPQHVVTVEFPEKPDIRLVPNPIEAFENFGPLELDKPISILGLSEPLRKRLPKQIAQIMDLFSTSTASLSLKNHAHELNTTLVAYAVRNFEGIDGFQEIMESPLSTYKLPHETDGQFLETVADAFRHDWKDADSERHYALALRRIFSKFILDHSVPGFAEICEKELKTFRLSTRLNNLFRSRDINKVEDLISYKMSDLKGIKMCGDKSIQEAKNLILEPNQLHFGTLDKLGVPKASRRVG